MITHLDDENMIPIQVNDTVWLACWKPNDHALQLAGYPQFIPLQNFPIAAAKLLSIEFPEGTRINWKAFKCSSRSTHIIRFEIGSYFTLNLEPGNDLNNLARWTSITDPSVRTLASLYDGLEFPAPPPPTYIPIPITENATGCECGVWKTGGIHSDWCKCS